MTIAEVLKLLEILAWPIVAVVAIAFVGPQIAKLLSGAKVKLSIGGQTIETTLPELKEVLEEQAGEPLTPQHFSYLIELQRGGTKRYSGGVQSSEERKLLRPLRNNGLVLTSPRNAFLGEAEAIELSALGRLYLRAKGERAEK
ncbi:MAG: hypothetical protein ACJ746_17630 [Bryobacteraceae bacterium]